MEQEQQRHQWTLHVHEEEAEEEEEVEGAALERRKFLPHSTGSEHGSLVRKEDEEHAVMGCVVVGGENGNHFKGEKSDFGAVGLGIVAECVGADATNGESVTDDATNGAAAALQKNNSVYFDKQLGMWKCHHCPWTKRYDSPWTVPVWNLNGYPDLLMNFKTMIQHGPCFVCETKGNEVNGLNGVQNGDSDRSVHATNHTECEIDVQVEDAVIPQSLRIEDNNQCVKTVNRKVPSSSKLTPLHNSYDIQVTSSMNFDSETSTKEGANFTKEIDHQLEDYDVEAVLAKQETHDLFCPNCNSCITKRVILKKRKRTIHSLDNKAKRDKLDAVVSHKLVDSFEQENNQGDQTNVTPDIVSLDQPDGSRDPEREPELFRCLSCFSFFIPIGKSFNLFRKVGGAREHETSQNPSNIPGSILQNPSNVPSSNANWLFFLFTSNDGKTASEQGNASNEHSKTGPTVQHHSTPISSNMQTSPEIDHHPEGPLADTALVKNVKPMLYTDHGHGGLNSMNSSPVESVKTEPWVENDMKSNMASGNESLADQKRLDSLFQNDLSSMQACTESAGDLNTREGEKRNDSEDMIKTNDVKDMSSMSFSDDGVSKHESVQLATAATTEILVNGGEPAKDSLLNPYEGTPEFPGPTTAESPVLEESPKGVNRTPETIQKHYSSLKQGRQSPVQSFGNAVLASDVASSKQRSVIDFIVPSKQDFTLTEKVKKDSEEEINRSDRKDKKGVDVIVFVEGEGAESTTSQIADNVPVGSAIMTESHTQAHIGEQPTTEIGETQQWEVIKSIVYGGLVESITSLGIVSSAAGSDAAPLNIIALGLANLVGGLFILGHNLSELKNDCSGGDQQQTNDRYQELLGRRANSLLHAIVAVLSFLIFGSVPIVIYGVLISKNYYAEVKLAAVAAASLACIILLAIGKVYTKRPPKSYIKSVSYYVSLAIAASGVSYIGGNLIKDLLVKFTHSESGFAVAMPISDNGMRPKWTSY